MQEQKISPNCPIGHIYTYFHGEVSSSWYVKRWQKLFRLTPLKSNIKITINTGYLTGDSQLPSGKFQCSGRIHSLKFPRVFFRNSTYTHIRIRELYRFPIHQVFCDRLLAVFFGGEERVTSSSPGHNTQTSSKINIDGVSQKFWNHPSKKPHKYGQKPMNLEIVGANKNFETQPLGPSSFFRDKGTIRRHKKSAARHKPICQWPSCWVVKWLEKWS